MLRYIFFVLIAVLVVFIMIRDRKTVAANAEVQINAPQDRVWRILTGISEWKNWKGDIESMQVDGDIGVGTIFVWKAGGISIESEITEYEPERRIVWKGKTFGIDAIHTWRFSETEQGTRVYTEEEFTGLLAWLLPGTMRNQIKKALTQGVNALKQASESVSS